MTKYSIILNTLILIFSSQIIYAGCGSCVAHNPKKNTETKENISLLSTIPNSGLIQGNVQASCGMCNFDVKSKRCSLYIKVGENSYSVKGTTINDHGDSHASDGFCNAIRTASVKGKVSDGIFWAETLELQ